MSQPPEIKENGDKKEHHGEHKNKHHKKKHESSSSDSDNHKERKRRERKKERKEHKHKKERKECGCKERKECDCKEQPKVEDKKSKSKSKSNSSHDSDKKCEKRGPRGKRGHKGKSGSKGERGPRGKSGSKGERGPKGKDYDYDLKKCCVKLSTPTGDLGLYHTFVMDCCEDNHHVLAYGYLKNHEETDVPTSLWATDDDDKKGLGIAADAEHEINKLSYVQFDLCHLIENQWIKKVDIKIGAIKCKEGFALYGSNCLGKLGEMIYKSHDRKSEQVITIPEYGRFKFVSVTATGCDDLSNVLVERLCIYKYKKPYEHAFAYVYSDAPQKVLLGAPISFEFQGPIKHFNQIDAYTLQCQVSGVYMEMMHVDSIGPNSCAIYKNGVIQSGSWFGANSGAQDMGQSILVLTKGDTLQVINQSSQDGAITLCALGSGASPSSNQSTAGFSVWRIA